jgi:hypothetical protein
MLLAWVAIVIAEGAVLYLGQRRLFWLVVDVTGSQWLAYAYAVPGTVLHEAAHYVMCLVLGVPAGRRVRGADGRPSRVEFFHPRRTEEGVILGQVPHARTGPLRQALVATAPVILVPPLLIGIAIALYGGPLAALGHEVSQAPWWKDLLGAYIAISVGHAAFPSPGDHIGILGGICLLIVIGVLLIIAAAHGGVVTITDGCRLIALVLAVPAAAATLLFGVLLSLQRRRR